MPNPATTATHETQHAIDERRPRSRTFGGIVLLALLLVLAAASSAHAGTYVINNCPSAPAPNGNPGPWSVFSSPQNAKGTCNGGAGDYIGPTGASMSPGSTDGVQVTVPSASTSTIREAKVWWNVPRQISGATTFPVVRANGAVIDEGETPLGAAAPNDYVLPSTTRTLALEDFCSADDGGQGCVFGDGENPNLQMFGAQLTIADSTLPNASVTGGALAGTRALSGTQALSYTAADPSSGIRLVKLLVDENPVAENDYLRQCPYDDFLACPASVSDTISWDTATVTDGQHALETIVEDAAQNTSVFYDTTITTDNAPTSTSAPAVITPGQPALGTTLSAQPGGWAAPSAAGAITYSYQWQTCNTEANDCQTIPGAQSAAYTPSPSDIGHTLRVLVNAADNDGTSSATTAPTSPVLSPHDTGSGVNGLTSTGLGAPNGNPASETAILQIQLHHTFYRSIAINRPFAKRALTLTGRLTNNHTQPIANATLDILQQTPGSDTLALTKHIKTSSTGTFTAPIPPGPSRLIEIAYRAFASDPTYTTTATAAETVQAGVHINITPHTTSPTGEITISGTVQGPIPPQGTIVELLVKYRGHWRPFSNPTTNKHGYFHITYQFQEALGQFPFQAKIPTGQANFPYTQGHSNTITVNTE